MRETRLFMTILLMSTLIALLIGCSKTEDERQQTSTSAAKSTTPVEHEVVLTVREFLKSMNGGDYDHAIGLGTPNEFNQEGLVKINEIVEFNKAEVTDAYVGYENAAVLTNSIPFTTGPATTGTVQFGFSLVKSGDRWLIRDVDMLPNNEVVQKWLAGFKGVEPTAKSVIGAD
jgi:hypothetical protein